ncbi:WD40 repeat-like protein [Cladochytrium tenue]|nr:WD40 repeat-like protein [Cladochytrium tenue]
MPATRVSIFAPLPATQRGHPVHLGEAPTPDGEVFLYSSGRSVYIRNLRDPRIATEYVGHAYPVTVAKYSPSGYYIASGGEWF